MAIPVQRFKVSDNETNIPVIDFFKVKSSEILNALTSGLEAIGGITDEITAMVGKFNDIEKNIENTITSTIDGVTNEIGSIVSSVSNVVNDSISSIVDPIVADVSRIAETGTSTINSITNQATTVVDGFSSSLLSGMDSVKSSLRQLSPERYTSILSTAATVPISTTKAIIAGVEYNINSTLNVAEELSKSVDKITNNFKPIFSNNSIIEKTTTALTVEASKINLPGVFTAFEKTYSDTTGILNAGNRLINYAADNKNTELMLEVINSPVNAKLAKINPTICKKLLANVSIPATIDTKDTLSFYDKIVSVASRANSDWNKTTINNKTILSTVNINAKNSDFNQLLATKALAKTTTPSTIVAADSVFDEAYLHVTNLLVKDSASNVIENDFKQLALSI